MDHTLSAKTAKFTSLENLYEYGICVSERLSLFLQLLMESLILSVMYVWCQLNADVIVSFWFGMRFKVCITQSICIILSCVTINMVTIFGAYKAVNKFLMFLSQKYFTTI